MTARTGHQQLLPAPTPIVSISKLNLGGPDGSNPRYMGSGTFIYRSPLIGPVVAVYTALLNNTRWSAIQYNAGTAGTPSLYFATQNGAIRDNGVYTTLQKWGVDPPPIPVIAYPAQPNFEEVASLPAGATNRFIDGVNGETPGPGHPFVWKGIIAISVLSPSGAASGYTKITPDPAAPFNGLNGIYIGMTVRITDIITSVQEDAVVLATDTDSFYVWLLFSFPLGNQPCIDAAQAPLTVPGAMYCGYSPDPLFSLNAAFNGIAANGYETSDVFHFGVYISDPSTVTSVSIQVVPNYQQAPYASDYYEYIVNATTQPAIYNPSANPATSEVWTEISVPKTSFAKIGNAGTGDYTWANINQVYIVAAGSAGTIKISGLYFTGGGGLNSTAGGTTPYDWMFTYRNPTTQAVGNPSALMIPANIPPSLTNGSMTLTLTGTVHVTTQANGIYELSGPGSINIFRRGGTFSDGFYRHVGYASNPGGGATVTFTDNASDQSLDTAATLEFDNDPPVHSNLPVPLTASIFRYQPAGGSSTSFTSSATVYGGLDTDLTTNRTVRIILNNPPTNFEPAQISTTITVGSTIQVGFGLTFEQCIISAVGFVHGIQSTQTFTGIAGTANIAGSGYINWISGDQFTADFVGQTLIYDSISYIVTQYFSSVLIQVNILTVPISGLPYTCSVVAGFAGDSPWVEVYLQYNHQITSGTPLADPSETVECDSILRGRCDLVHQDFDCLFLAGDTNNPATLYQSKIGRPEAFPVANLENGFAQQINVGSPSNPINGITSIGPGELVCLNLNNLFIVQVWQGQMQQPIQAPATRGLYSKWCWCKGDNRIWYLGYDGIYAWAGGQSQKVTEKIDWMFKNQTVNGIPPIDFTQAIKFSFAFAENCLFAVVIDINSVYRRLRYETLYDRWATEVIYTSTSGTESYTIDSLFTEPDTGWLLLGVTNPEFM